MAERTCHNCAYAVCEPCRWLRLIFKGEPIVPRCANHPFWPGQLHDVPGIPCRNYRPRPPVPDSDAVRLIPLGDGCYAYVDAIDYEWLSQWKWHLCGSGYPSRWENRKRVFMHRLIMKCPRNMLVDHKDGNRANNCRCNLRLCTHAENACNRRKYSASDSKFKGVYWDRRKRKWFINCRYKGRNHRLGYFGDDEVAAARAYDRVAVERIGDFAKLNFPEEWPSEKRAEAYAKYQQAEGKAKRKETKGKTSSRRTHVARRTTGREKVGRSEGRKVGAKQRRSAAGRKSHTGTRKGQPR